MAENTPPYPYAEFTGTADTTDTGGIQSVDTVTDVFAKAREADAASTVPEGMPYGVEQDAKGAFVDIAPDVNGAYIRDGVTYQTSAQKVTAAQA